MPFDFDSGIASIEWIEACLISVNINDHVTDIKQDSADSTTAQLSRLHITFSGSPPINAILKVMHEPFFQDGCNEIRFYKQAHRNGPPVLILRYLGGTIEDSQRATALLIEELEGDFLEYDWNERKEPDKNKVLRLIAALSQLHSTTWNQEAQWGRRRYSREVAGAASAAVDFPALLQKFIVRSRGHVNSRAETALEGFMLIFVDRFMEFLDSAPMMSVIHGDVHFGNLMIPRDHDQDVAMIDWANWSIDQPTDDLAHAVISQLPPSFSASHADEFIEFYLYMLRSAGVNYADQVFRRDFQFAIARQLIRPIIIAELVAGIDDIVWQEMLVNIFAGVDKFDVWPLLES